MTVKIAPEFTRVKKGSGQAVALPILPAVQKRWLASNFRLKIDGLDETCQHVNKIEALVIKQKVLEFHEGESRDTQLIPTTLEYPNLVITFPETHAQPVQDWFDSFVLNGENGQDREKGGTLEYLTLDLKSDLGALQFFHLGIFRLDEDENDSSNVRRLKAEMYCEEITFGVGGLPNPTS